MKFLFTITLLALVGCSGGKRVIHPETYPTCEEFYDFYRDEAKNLSLSLKIPETEIDTIFNKRLELLENIEKYHCQDNNITCDGRTFCYFPSHFSRRF